MANTSKATWARWSWSHGLGRGHRLFADGDLTKTACGSARKSASHTAVETSATRPNWTLCPVCKSLDDLAQKVWAGELTDAVATTTVEVTLPERPLVPVGTCICGAATCSTEETRTYREALVAYEAEVAAAKQAGFAAFLAERETASAAS